MTSGSKKALVTKSLSCDFSFPGLIKGNSNLTLVWVNSIHRQQMKQTIQQHFDLQDRFDQYISNHFFKKIVTLSKTNSKNCIYHEFIFLLDVFVKFV